MIIALYTSARMERRTVKDVGRAEKKRKKNIISRLSLQTLIASIFPN